MVARRALSTKNFFFLLLPTVTYVIIWVRWIDDTTDAPVRHGVGVKIKRVEGSNLKI